MSQQSEALKERAESFAVRVVKMFRALPRTTEARLLGRQVIRSATSVAANYRAACRARSKAEFIAKIGVVAEEADETQFWLEMLVDRGVVKPSRMAALLAEAAQLLAIFVASGRTARINPQSAIGNSQSRGSPRPRR